MNEKVIDILRRLYEVVLAEENGSAEHVCEWFSSEDLEELFSELNIDIPSNLEEDEIEEAVDDFIDEFGWESIDDYNEEEAKEWLSEIGANEAAREKIITAIKESLN